MNWNLYLLLSAMMFLQFAVWGAWSPVLAARLLGPLKFTGKQTGWIYGTMALGSIVSPLVAGQMADQWVHTETILAVCHLAGAVLLLVAARTARFGRLFAVMGAYSLFYAATVPLSFSLFLILSFVVFAQLQFYFLGTAPFLGDVGVQAKHIPAAMAVAQAAQIFATYVLLGFFLERGYRVTLAAGAGAWLAMYLLYVWGRPRALVILSMGLHGIAYTLFVFGGQVYTDAVGGEIRGSAQALLTAVTLGAGLFAGSRFAGVVMDRHVHDGRFAWRRIFLAPCVLTGVCAILFLLFFRNPPGG